MSEASARWALPFIMPGQAQKEWFHNEALARLDVLAQAAVEDRAVAMPTAPREGQCWIVGDGGTGMWEGRVHQIAAWTSGGWRFLLPRAGMSVWNKAAGHAVHWTGTGWSDGTLPVAGISVGGVRVVGARQPGVLSPSGGTVIDAEARDALTQVIVALRTHGLIE